MRRFIVDSAHIFDAAVGNSILLLVYHRYNATPGVIYERGADKSPAIDVNRLDDATVEQAYNIVASHAHSLRGSVP